MSRALVVVLLVALNAPRAFAESSELESDDHPTKVELVPQARPVDDPFQASTPLYARWYVWAGAGLLSTAATLALGLLVAMVVDHQFSPFARPPIRTPAEMCGGGTCDACIGTRCE